MAVPRKARIIESVRLGPETRLLTVQLLDGESLGFIGGQYIIVDSGIQLPNGKMAKRAYSLISSDSRQDQFQLAVKKLDSGPASNYMHELSVNDTILFSGPWGKFCLDDGASNQQSSWIVATDTAISCVLGLLSSQASGQFSKKAHVTWLVESDDYFLPLDFVKETIPLTTFHPERIEPVGDSNRVRTALTLLEKLFENPDVFFLAGDGAVIYPMRERLLMSGRREEQFHLECYFNNPEKKSV